MTRYLEPFRRKVLELIAEGKHVKHVAEDLGLSQQTIYNWRAQKLINMVEGSDKSSVDSCPPVIRAEPDARISDIRGFCMK
ncbi:helix-turn-helix domain-containing protein [Leucobacter salsicius]|uniref:helix-turn-helix domain-containing protein n=1 Tax=Leucobacter salsicius TaxID=664638 RepID=UPI000A02CED1|nr:helix-turn-helix domain-containing protein [Leucobacter salsicius]